MGQARGYMQLPVPRAREAKEILESLSLNATIAASRGFQELLARARKVASEQKVQNSKASEFLGK